ncbi:hypothetical protein HN011_011600 [Eciton burchellii]|nr:hypothetical protein HN011_011600 [Eciton burchellii]
MPDVSTSSAHPAGFINAEEAAVPSSQAQHRVAILGRSLSREEFDYSTNLIEYRLPSFGNVSHQTAVVEQRMQIWEEIWQKDGRRRFLFRGSEHSVDCAVPLMIQENGCAAFTTTVRSRDTFNNSLSEPYTCFGVFYSPLTRILEESF